MSLKTHCLIQIKAQFAILFFFIYTTNLTSFWCFPSMLSIRISFLFRIIWFVRFWKVPDIHKRYDVKNWKPENNEICSWSGLKIKSWNKHVQINHNFGHISITWPLEMLNAHAVKWTYLEYWCKMLRANEWPLLDIGCFKTRRVWVKKVRKSTQKVNNATIWHMWQLYVLALCHMSHSLTVSKITIVTNDEFSF